MQKSDFDRLLERYLTGNLSQEEKTKLEAWLDSFKKNDEDDIQLSREEEDKIFRRITGNITLQEAMASPPEEPAKKSKPSQWVKMLTLGLLMVGVLSYGVWYLADRGEEMFAAKDDINKLILNDGSLVWLDDDSKLTFYEKAGIRYAELEGEALFEVAKDPSHPFQLRCGEALINVVGTSFSVKTGADTLELSVLTGLVNFEVPDKAVEAVAAHEKVVYVRNGAITKTSLEEKTIQAITNGTEYNMAFENTTLEDVVERMSEKFDVTIRIEDRNARRCSLTADFTDHSLEGTLTMITEVLDVDYMKEGKIITLRGSGCP